MAAHIETFARLAPHLLTLDSSLRPLLREVAPGSTLDPTDAQWLLDTLGQYVGVANEALTAARAIFPPPANGGA